MSKLYVGFSKRKSFNLVSETIKQVEGTPFSHVYVRIESTWLERDVIYEASGTTVHFKAKPLWLEAQDIVAEFEVEMSSGGNKKLMQFCMDNAGRSYGLKSLLGFFVVYVGRLIGRRWRNPFRDGRATYVCSELGAVVLNDLADDPIDADDMTPKELYNHMLGRYRKIA